MKIEAWLANSTKLLNDAGIGTGRLDCLILLEHVTGMDRARLLAEPDIKLTAPQSSRLNNLLKRRADHEPLAYILGQVEFYGRTFVVNEYVLVPRPESETMIEELLKLSKIGTHPVIADVGAGSGALGITAKLELADATVELIDIDRKALEVAKINVDKFTLPISTIESDLLSDAGSKYDVLLCNLPYVPDDFKINTAATKEPKLAIYGGLDGLYLYRRLFNQINKRQNRPLYLLCESLPMQHDALQALAKTNGYEMLNENDFIQVFERTQK